MDQIKEKYKKKYEILSRRKKPQDKIVISLKCMVSEDQIPDGESKTLFVNDEEIMIE